MATQTTNIGLILPIGTENVSRTVINTNWETIDAIVGAVPQGKTLQEQLEDIDGIVGDVPVGETLQGQIDDIVAVRPSATQIDGAKYQINL